MCVGTIAGGKSTQGVSFSAYFKKNNFSSELYFFFGYVLLTAKDTCMVPIGFTLAKQSCYNTVPWVLCQLQRLFSYMPPAAYNLFPYSIA